WVVVTGPPRRRYSMPSSGSCATGEVATTAACSFSRAAANSCGSPADSCPVRCVRSFRAGYVRSVSVPHPGEWCGTLRLSARGDDTDPGVPRPAYGTAGGWPRRRNGLVVASGRGCDGSCRRVRFVAAMFVAVGGGDEPCTDRWVGDPVGGPAHPLAREQNAECDATEDDQPRADRTVDGVHGLGPPQRVHDHRV